MQSQQSCEYDVRADSSQRSNAGVGERRKTQSASGALRCRRKFLRFFPDGEGGIVLWFFLASLAAGFALKNRFGVTL